MWNGSDFSPIVDGAWTLGTADAPAGGGTSPVPETSTSFGLLALGAGGLLTRRRLKRAAWTV